MSAWGKKPKFCVSRLRSLSFRLTAQSLQSSPSGYFLGHPVDLLLLLQHVKGPRIAERLVGGRAGQQTGVVGLMMAWAFIDKSSYWGKRDSTPSMRADDGGAKGKCGYVAITFCKTARYGRQKRDFRG